MRQAVITFPEKNRQRMNEITLLIADDHPLFRQGVVDTLSLEKDFRIIAQAASRGAGRQHARAKWPASDASGYL